MVPAESLEKAVNLLNKYSKKATRITFVNWRGSYQVKMGWYGGAALECFLDFQGDKAARDAVLKAVFEKHAAPGGEPATIDGHGWSFSDYTLIAEPFISLNEVAGIAEQMGFQFSVLYVQEDISARPVFEVMGIPLVPGEMGKEWKGGQFHSYTRSVDACL